MWKRRPSGPAHTVETLAEFRHQIRLFLRFSEATAQKRGLLPQQHQLLLQVAGAPDNVPASIGYAAERLGLRHNTVVELCNRCEDAGLIVRRQAESDRRSVLLELSPKGQKELEALSMDHARELNERAPQLIRTLTTLGAVHSKPRRRTARRNSGI